MKKLLFPVLAAALMTGCAGLPIPTDKATFQSVADKVQGIRDFEADGLIQAADLRAAHARLLASQAPFVYTVAEFGFPIQRAVRMDAQGRVTWQRDVMRSLVRPCLNGVCKKHHWWQHETKARCRAWSENLQSGSAP